MSSIETNYSCYRNTIFDSVIYPMIRAVISHMTLFELV